MKRTLRIVLFFLGAVVLFYLLSAIFISKFVDTTVKAKIVTTRVTLKVLLTAVDMFKLDTGRYPTKEEGLGVLVQEPDGVENWPDGGYIEMDQVPPDAWKHPFIYRVLPDPNTPFEIISLGADGKPGGSGENADLSSLKNR